MPPRISRLNRITQIAPQPTTQPIPMRPPMTGWNTRDDLDGMDPTDAIVIDNFYADAGGLNLRKGSQIWSLPLGAPVETLSEYYAGPVRKLIAAAGTSVFDVTGGSTSATLGTGFNNALWSAANFSNRLFMANGADPVQVIQTTGGTTTMASAAFTGPPSPPSGVFVFKNRLFFWLPASPAFWYAPLYNVTGALSSFDLSTIAQWGGNILCLTNFSHDGGEGMTNTFVAVMTTGEILLYIGDDPSLSTNWQIVGKYKLGAPINGRSVAPYGGDVYLTTQDDHVALQEQLVALKTGQTPPRSKISGAVREVIAQSQATTTPGYGFQSLYYGKGRRVVFNVPGSEGPGFWDQHIYNTSNQSWQRFKGMNALCWSEFNQNLFFGATNGRVYQADVGTTDSTLPIDAICQQAWNNVSIPTAKRVAGVRPIITTAGQSYKFYVGYDYRSMLLAVVAQRFPYGAIWDISPWDTTYWDSIGNDIDIAVHAAAGSGTVVSVQLTVSATTTLVWMRTDLVIESAKQI